MIKQFLLIFLFISIPFSLYGQLFKFGYKKNYTDELVISKNKKKKKVEIFVRDGLALEEFIKNESDAIQKIESYISPSFVGKIVNSDDQSEAYLNSFNEDFSLLFVYKGKTRVFKEGVQGANYFGFSTKVNKILVDGSYRLEESSNNEVLEIIQLSLNEEQWVELSESEDIRLDVFGEKSIEIGEMTQHYMKLITEEISMLKEDWYNSEK